MGVGLQRFSTLLRRSALRLSVLGCSVLAFSLPASAGELSLLINGKAIHFDSRPGNTYNERNWGAGLQYDFDPVADGRWVPFMSVSGFLDSNENPSYYAGGGAMRRYRLGRPEWDAHVEIGAIGFAMVRENFRAGHPFLGVLPVASLGAGRVALNVTYIPKVDPKMVPLLFFQVKVGMF